MRLFVRSQRKGEKRVPHDGNESARTAEDDHSGGDFAALAAFLFARIDPLLLARPFGEEIDPALQALNDAVRTLLGQARAFREWNNEPAVAAAWDALTAIARPWRGHPDFHWSWEKE
ncbi:hypothetical protein ACWC3X_36350 [Streptomyces populi]|jgi:hypothetical protein